MGSAEERQHELDATKMRFVYEYLRKKLESEARAGHSVAIGDT